MSTTAPSVSEINEREEDEVFAEDPNLTAAEESSGPVDDTIINLQREKQQVDAARDFICARSFSKRKHTKITRQVKQAIDNHIKGIRLSKAELSKTKTILTQCLCRCCAKHLRESTRYLPRMAFSVQLRPQEYNRRYRWAPELTVDRTVGRLVFEIFKHPVWAERDSRPVK